MVAYTNVNAHVDLQIAFPTLNFYDTACFLASANEFLQLCGNRKHKSVWSKHLEDVKRSSFCNTEVLLKLKGMAFY